MSEFPIISAETAEKLSKAVQEHFDFNKEANVVIITEDGNCFVPDSTNDAWNHMRDAKLKAFIVTRDGNASEFTGSKKEVKPAMTESDEKRKENAQKVLDEQEMAAKQAAEEQAKAAQEAADLKAKEEADAKAKAEQEAAELKEKEDAEAKSKEEDKAKETKESKAKATK